MRKQILFVVVPLLAACSGGSGASFSDSTGVLELRLTDTPTTGVAGIVVSIDRVDVHAIGGGWVTVSRAYTTIDLLALRTGAFALLDSVQWPAGKLTGFRLHVSALGPNYVRTLDGVEHPLRVPSWDVEIRGDFDVPACASGAITFDFVCQPSIAVEHDDGCGCDRWTLRPVVRVKEAIFHGSCADAGPPDAADAADAADAGDASDGGCSWSSKGGACRSGGDDRCTEGKKPKCGGDDDENEDDEGDDEHHKNHGHSCKNPH